MDYNTPRTMETPDKAFVESQINDFIYYFLRKIEERFMFYLNILEGNPTGSKPVSLTGNVLAGAAAIIPSVGKAVSEGIKQSDVFMAKKTDKDDAFVLADIIYYHRNNSEEVRNILIEASYEIFCCYEMQFLRLTCNGGPTRAMQKLGDDAAQRYINYLKKNKCESINNELVIKSIVFDNSTFLNNLGIIKMGHTVKDERNNSWKSAKIYTKVGLYDKATNTFYKNKKSNTSAYGHRLRFSYESNEDIIYDWEKDDVVYNYNYITNISNLETDFDEILKYILLKDPEEAAKMDRENKHEETLNALNDNHEEAKDDRVVKHVEAKEHREEILTDLKTETQKNHVEVTTLLTTIAEKQNEIVQNEEALKNELSNKTSLVVVEDIVQQKIKEREADDPKIVIKLDREGIERELKKLDFTNSSDFKKIKDKIRKFRF